MSIIFSLSICRSSHIDLSQTIDLKIYLFVFYHNFVHSYKVFCVKGALIRSFCVMTFYYFSIRKFFVR